jgi:hypothetical protein
MAKGLGAKAPLQSFSYRVGSRVRSALKAPDVQERSGHISGRQPRQSYCTRSRSDSLPKHVPFSTKPTLRPFAPRSLPKNVSDQPSPASDEAAPSTRVQTKAEPNHRTKKVMRTATAPHSEGFRLKEGAGARVFLLIVATGLSGTRHGPNGARRAHAPSHW